ncbi:MAG: hypothetical protein AAB035_06290, partial [Nitrospirota bacterium]
MYFLTLPNRVFWFSSKIAVLFITLLPFILFASNVAFALPQFSIRYGDEIYGGNHEIAANRSPFPMASSPTLSPQGTLPQNRILILQKRD